MSEKAETCSEEMWDGWRSYACPRPVKRDGLCGPHAAGKVRSAKAAAAREQRCAEDRARQDAKSARQADLLAAEATVARVQALYDDWHRHGIGISLDRLNELRDVLAAQPARTQQPDLSGGAA